ncbi:MAG TPA: lysylphosphatidylglycerol synthase transmembrane domain-containing protein [Vicinamibacterales bacterium]
MRRFAVIAIKVIVSVALMAVLFSRIDARQLWSSARRASIGWLLAALALYFTTVLAATWRWQLLLNAQEVRVPARRLLGSYLVATFFGNFLPSNIGGDVIRIRDTAKPAASKTLATTVVLTDRVMGVVGLALVAALGATVGAGMAGHGRSPIWPSWLWAGFVLAAAVSALIVLAPDAVTRVLKPLTVIHPEWVGGRIETLTSVFQRFRTRPLSLVGCFVGAVYVQSALVVFYLLVVYALHINVQLVDLAVIVPLSLVVQMIPVSVGGFGVREATFSIYFSRIGLPMESAVVMSLVAAALIVFISLTGAAVYVARGRV